MELTLVIMAAGMGSRYGGLKQIDPIGPNGEIILEYSIYDAIRAGFKKVAFVIREEMKSDFKDFIEKKLKDKIEIDYIVQSLDKVPNGYKVPQGREKPFGTGHAILCCKDNIQGPFTVINADDYYGYDSFKKIADFLLENRDENQYAMVGFKVENTLTEFGSVARGVCEIDGDGYLASVKEYTEIKAVENNGICYFKDNQWNKIEESTIVSMNMWGFKRSIFNELEKEFTEFLKTIEDNPLKKEFYIPSVVDNMILTDKAKVKVLSSDEKWYGVTYREDREFVQQAIRSMVGKNYPENLWGEKNN